MTTQNIYTRVGPRADFHQEYIDQQEQQRPRTWGGFLHDNSYYIAAGAAGAAAVAATAYGRCGHQNSPAKLSEGQPARGAAGLNAVNVRQAHAALAPAHGPAWDCLRGPRWNPGQVADAQAALRAMPAPQNTFQRGVLRAQDNAVDAAAAAGVGAAIGALVGGPLGAVLGLAAGGLIAGIGGEMRGR